MARTDHYRDPDAPRANSVVPSVVAVVRTIAPAGSCAPGVVQPQTVVSGKQFSIAFRARPVGGALRTEPYLG